MSINDTIKDVRLPAGWTSNLRSESDHSWVVDISYCETRFDANPVDVTANSIADEIVVEVDHAGRELLLVRVPVLYF